MYKNKFISYVLILTIAFCSFLNTAIFADEPDIITRGEAAEILLNAADFYNPDVKKEDIIKGYSDGLLHEEKAVSRVEALIMISRAFGNIPLPTGHNARVAFPRSKLSDIPIWAEDEISGLLNAGIISGDSDGFLNPYENMTLSEINTVIKRLYSLYGTNLKDNFYAAVNKDDLESLELLPGTNSSGVISILGAEANTDLINIILDLSKNTYEKGTKEQKISDLYKLAADTKSRDELGISPIKNYLDMIKSAKNLDELINAHNSITKDLGTNLLLSFELSTDPSDSSKYVLYFYTYYPDVSEEVFSADGSNKQKNALINYINKLLVLSGNSEEEAAEKTKSIFDIQTALSESCHLALEDYDDISKTYNIYTLDELDNLFKNIDLNSVYDAIGFKPADKIIVADEELIKAFAEMFNEDNLEGLKALSEYSLVYAFSQYLNHEFVDAEQEFSAEYYGTEESLSYQAVNLYIINNIMYDYLGQIYVENYFSEESKEEVYKIALDIIDVYKKRINNLTWMSSETKEKALKKLDSMNIKVGYPEDTSSFFDSIDIKSKEEGGTFFDNLIYIQKMIVANNLDCQFTEIDKSLWDVTPQTANAFYGLGNNDITLPAAILQPPVYDADASYEEKLGTIGTIIAHEITHAFDNNGAKYDENGNVSDWWTEEDYEKFDELCNDAAVFFDGQESIPGVCVDGFQTLSENIADLGALFCTTEAVSNLENPDYKAFFESYAKMWLNTGTRDYYVYMFQNNVHSPENVRVNRVLQNIGKFYEVYQITPGDGMYEPAENRIEIW